MPITVHAALIETLKRHFALRNSRLETLAVLIVALVQGRTVNLSHVASHFPGAAQHGSNYRRLQRFFQSIRLDQAVVAQLVVRMLNLSRPKYLALDRTNWKVGCKDINILMLAIVTRRFRVPLLWTVIDRQGNSNTGQRIELMRRYLSLFGAASIELLLADREFIGADWVKFLMENKVPFAIRVKQGQCVALADGRLWTIKSLLRRRRKSRSLTTFQASLPDASTVLSFAVKWIDGRKGQQGEWLIVMTNSPDAKAAISAYKNRWAVECLFADAKTRGFNMEDTRMTAPDKIDTLTTVLAIAVTWTYRCATQTMGMKAIKRKVHGRREKSWFRTGLDALRAWITFAPQHAIRAWQNQCPKRLKNL
ncbi:IS4 family transposase [Mesorhizobium australafricanum]|uniref:IS4 family transposase n=1 Tax=Mesorhizobium australafricanum TaxID=3072311 RepID=A0ABU4X6M9_9HYPH|nr:IS4 family transposase [Mesorhizobium sp. VK3E]MDX8443953.1 IS4 family transposase [Mesorhizobium sp. VK3E]